ncbi:MAG: hypothetical protein ABIT36_11895 [Steroidobacteraceae bacterium]
MHETLRHDFHSHHFGVLRGTIVEDARISKLRAQEVEALLKGTGLTAFEYKVSWQDAATKTTGTDGPTTRKVTVIVNKSPRWRFSGFFRHLVGARPLLLVVEPGLHSAAIVDRPFRPPCAQAQCRSSRTALRSGDRI